MKMKKPTKEPREAALWLEKRSDNVGGDLGVSITILVGVPKACTATTEEILKAFSEHCQRLYFDLGTVLNNRL